MALNVPLNVLVEPVIEPVNFPANIVNGVTDTLQLLHVPVMLFRVAPVEP